MKTPIEIKYFKNIYDNEATRNKIREVLLKKGSFLIDSLTGSGKTYAIVKIMQELAKEYPNKVFIIACPNRIQNMQNEKEYKVVAIVGEGKGSKTYEHICVASMVYDKAIDILESNYLMKKEITLVIDEAHQLIYGKGYRGKAINSLLKLSENTFNTIHLSATTRSLKEAYNYDEMYSFTPNENINNISRLILTKTNDKELALLKCIQAAFNSNSKVLLYLNNKSKINEVNKILETHYKDKNIKSLCRDKNNNISDPEIYNSIVNDSLIPGDIDLLLVTSFIECGTNIKNENVVPIMYVDSNKNFNLDGCTQFFARLRNKVDIGFLIYSPKKLKEGQEFNRLTLKDLINIENKYAEKSINFLDNTLISFVEEIGVVNAIKLIKGTMETETVEGYRFNKGYIYLNEETLEFEIDRELFYKYIFDNHDSQLLNDDSLLLNNLKGNIKASEIECKSFSKGVANKADEDVINELKENIKESKECAKEYRQELKASLIELVKDSDNKHMFLEYILATDDINRELYKNNSKEELRMLIEKLEAEIKVLKGINKVVKSYKEALSTVYTDEEIVFIYLNNEFDEEVLKKEQFRIWNNLDMKELKGSNIRYSVIRNRLDARIQKRLSKKEMLVLFNELYPRNKKDKLTQSNEKKLINEIGLIYKLNTDSKGHIISSLNK